MGQRTVLLIPDGVATNNNSGLSIVALSNIQAIDVANGIMSLTADATMTFDNLTLAAGETITSITPTMTGTILSGAAVTIVIQQEILESDDTQLYTQNIGPNGADEATYVGTTRTTSDGSTAWSNNDIDGLKIKLTFLANTATRFWLLDFIGVTVVIETPPNIKGKIQHTSGKIQHTSGKIEMIDIP